MTCRAVYIYTIVNLTYRNSPSIPSTLVFGRIGLAWKIRHFLHFEGCSLLLICTKPITYTTVGYTHRSPAWTTAKQFGQMPKLFEYYSRNTTSMTVYKYILKMLMQNYYCVCMHGGLTNDEPYIVQQPFPTVQPMCPIAASVPLQFDEL